MGSEKNLNDKQNFRCGENSQQASSFVNTYEEFPPIESYLPKSKFENFFLIFKKYMICIAIGTFLLLTAVVSFSLVYKIGRETDSIDEIPQTTTLENFTTSSLLSSPNEKTTIFDDSGTSSPIESSTSSNQITDKTTLSTESSTSSDISDQSTTTQSVATTISSTTTTQDPYNYIAAILDQGECITRNDIVVSHNACFYLQIRNDGNMVIYRVRDNLVIWSTSSTGSDGRRTCMQTDGNFLMYTSNNNIAWQLPLSWRLLHVTNIFNQPEYAVLENDGNLLLKKYKGTVKWSSESVSTC